MDKNDRLTRQQRRLNRWIEYAILAVAFFLPMSLNATSFFLAVGTGLWLWKMALARRMNLRRTPFDILIFVLVGLSAASVWDAPDQGLSFYNYYHLMGRYILLYYLVVNNLFSVAQVKRLVTAVLLSAGVVTAYGFYQYFHGVDISANQWVDSEQFPDLKLRVFSTLENPNLLAGYLVTMMAVAVGLGLKAYRAKGKLVLLILVWAMAGCLVLTYSRGAWLSVLAVFFTFGVLYSRKIFWLLVLVPVVIIVGHDVFLERVMSIMNPTDTSANLRWALWESTVAMISENPWLGIGWGSYSLVYPEYDFFGLETTIFHAHNMYLHLAAEIGIPGLLVFLAIFWGHARRALAMARGAANRWTAGLMLGLVAALVGIAVGGVTDYVLFNIQLSMLYWLINAVVVVIFLGGAGNKKFVK